MLRLARARAREAAHRLPARSRLLRLGPLALRLHFLGAELERSFGPALAALEAAEGAGDIAVWLLDSRALGIPPPPRWPVPIVELGPGRRYRSGGGLECYFEAVGQSWHIYDRAAREAYFWTADAGALPVWDVGEPLRTLFAWFLDETGHLPVHAGAVGDERGALLLFGPGGTGKSSTVLSCLGGTMRILGDDFVLVDSATACVHALYASAKLSVEGAARLPELTAKALNPERGVEEKLVFALDFSASTAFRRLPIAAIVLPRIAGTAASCFMPATAAEALRAVAPNTVLLLPGAGARALAKLARIVESVPIYRLDLGHDRSGVVRALDRLLDAAASQPSRARRSD